MTVVRAIRGATTARENTKESILESTRELLEEIVKVNDLQQEGIVLSLIHI